MSTPIEERAAFGAYTNTDLTEGRGSEVLIGVSLCEATARRIAHKRGVMGTDGTVRKMTLYKHSAWWYGPVSLEQPTDADRAAQDRIDAGRTALQKAKDAGLTDADIAALARGTA